jgi:hypothetical protein
MNRKILGLDVERLISSDSKDLLRGKGTYLDAVKLFRLSLRFYSSAAK